MFNNQYQHESPTPPPHLYQNYSFNTLNAATNQNVFFNPMNNKYYAAPSANQFPHSHHQQQQQQQHQSIQHNQCQSQFVQQGSPSPSQHHFQYNPVQSSQQPLQIQMHLPFKTTAVSSSSQQSPNILMIKQESIEHNAFNNQQSGININDLVNCKPKLN